MYFKEEEEKKMKRKDIKKWLNNSAFGNEMEFIRIPIIESFIVQYRYLLEME